MSLPAFLGASLIIALVLIAPLSRGPDEMLVNALIVWVPPALLAVLLRNRVKLASRLALPALGFAALLALMLLGMS